MLGENTSPHHSLSGLFASLLPGTASLEFFKRLFFPALYIHRKLQPASTGETSQTPENSERGKGKMDTHGRVSILVKHSPCRLWLLLLGGSLPSWGDMEPGAVLLPLSGLIPLMQTLRGPRHRGLVPS